MILKILAEIYRLAKPALPPLLEALKAAGRGDEDRAAREFREVARQQALFAAARRRLNG